MADEFRHATVGTELTQLEYENNQGHTFDGQVEGDLLIATSPTQLSRLPVAPGVLIGASAGRPSYDSTRLTKLDGVEVGAQVNVGVEYTQSEKNKLGGVESGATTDQSAGEIKSAYESNSDTNAFTDAEQTKLSNLSNTVAGSGGFTSIFSGNVDISANGTVAPTTEFDLTIPNNVEWLFFTARDNASYGTGWINVAELNLLATLTAGSSYSASGTNYLPFFLAHSGTTAQVIVFGHDGDELRVGASSGSLDPMPLNIWSWS